MHKKSLKKTGVVFFSLIIAVFFLNSCQKEGKDRAKKFRFSLSFAESLSQEPLDGRMLLLISNDNSQEPRFQINDGPNTQLIFGVDINGLKPGDAALIDESVFGYPVPRISEIPPGTYTIQAFLNRYETFHRADGHVVKLPMDKGEGQRWVQKPGNFFSTPQDVKIDPQKAKMITIVLDQEIPPIPDPPETKYIKHIKIQSQLLTEFWGRPMFLGAHILLPEGFDTHPEARYPLVINGTSGRRSIRRSAKTDTLNPSGTS